MVVGREEEGGAKRQRADRRERAKDARGRGRRAEGIKEAAQRFCPQPKSLAGSACVPTNGRTEGWTDGGMEGRSVLIEILPAALHRPLTGSLGGGVVGLQ